MERTSPSETTIAIAREGDTPSSVTAAMDAVGSWCWAKKEEFFSSRAGYLFEPRL